MVAADLLLQLPQEVDIDRDIRGSRGECTEQGRQRGALIVGRATTDVAIAVRGELKRIGAPVLAVRRLDVQVVVHRNRRPSRHVAQSGMDQRVAAGLEQLAARADLREAVEAGLGTAPDVCGAGRIDRHAWDVDQPGQPALEIRAVMRGELGELGARGG